MPGRYRNKTIVAALLLFILISRLPTLLAPVFDIDEADAAVETATWLSGGKLYIDAVEKKPPLLHLAYAAAFFIGGLWNMAAVHILFAVIVAVTGLAIMAAVRRAWGGDAGIVALALFAAYQAGYDINDFLVANPGILVNAAWAAAAYFAMAALGKNKRSMHLFLSGAFVGVSVLAKPLAMAFLPALLIADWWSRFSTLSLRAPKGRSNPTDSMGLLRPASGRARNDTCAAVTDAIALFSGLLLPLAVASAILWRSGILSDAFYWSWTANFVYAKSPLPLLFLLQHGAVRLGIYVLVSLPLWVLAVGGAIHKIRRRSFAAVDLFLLLWLLAALATCAAGWRFFPQYFLQLVPPLVLMATIGWTSWLRPFVLPRKGIRIASIAVGLALPMIAFTIFHVHEALNFHKKTEVEREIARAVAQRTAPDSRIFVWGHSSDIYFYSRRLPASRFVYCSFLTGASEGFEDMNRLGPRNEDAWRMLMDDLGKKPPELIADMSGTNIRGYGAYPIEAFPELDDYILRNYYEEATVAGSKLFKRHP